VQSERELNFSHDRLRVLHQLTADPAFQSANVQRATTLAAQLRGLCILGQNPDRESTNQSDRQTKRQRPKYLTHQIHPNSLCDSLSSHLVYGYLKGSVRALCRTCMPHARPPKAPMSTRSTPNGLSSAFLKASLNPASERGRCHPWWRLVVQATTKR
jgi:hypothetical protein